MKSDIVFFVRGTISITFALCLLAGTLHAQSNLVANGSFEAGTDGREYARRRPFLCWKSNAMRY